MVDITVCTVSFHNAPYLRLNWHLCEHLNDGDSGVSWIVAENTPEGASDRLAPDNPHFTVIPGEGPGLRPNFQHTLALHRCLDLVKTRYLLVLDPDFYLVRPHWVRDVVEHMQREKLTFFGVPWHPKFSDKYRYFPAIHCFFVDLEKIDRSELDFRPLVKIQPPCKAPHGRTRVGDWLGLSARRRAIADSGTRMFQRFANDPAHRYECALPVFRLPEDKPISRSWRSRALEIFLPDELCYLPKRRDTYTSRGLRELGFLKAAPANWEEFMWRGAPLGFHVRRNAGKQKRHAEQELEVLRSAVHQFETTAPARVPA